MKLFFKKNERAVNFLFCELCAYMLTGGMLLLLALLLYKFQVPKWVVFAGITIIYVTACFFGGFMLGKKMKEKKFLWGLFLGMAYFLILLIISLLANGGVKGDLGNLFLTMALCMSGGMLGGMLG